MPVLEVVVAAVAHEVAAPDGLHLSDRPLADDVAERAHHRHVAHIVPDVEGGPGPVRGLQDAVGALDRDGDGLLQVDGGAGLQQGAGDGLVRVVWAGDDRRVDPGGEELVGVLHPGQVLAERSGRTRAHLRVGVGSAHEAGAEARPGQVRCDGASGSEADDSNAQLGDHGSSVG